MDVRTFLGLVGDRSLSTIQPEGQQVVDLLNKYSEEKHSVLGLTGITASEVIDALDSQDRDEIYLTELNDGVDLAKYRRELQSFIDQKNSDGKTLRKVLAFGMATLLAVLTLCLSYAIVHVALVQKELPPWELCLIAFGGPAMVVWQFNGVLAQENKDFLAAALGRTPQAGIIGGLLSSMGASRDVRRRRDDMYEEDFQPRPRSRPRDRSATDHGGPPAV